MKNVALYFGSFSPVHNGHIGLAKHLLKVRPIDELWFVLTPHNPLKPKNLLIEDHHRIEMLRLALHDLLQIKICTDELHLPQPNYTINTLEYLSAQHPNSKFSLLIGADNMQIFDKWKDYNKILNNYNIIVYPRKGYAPSNNLFLQMDILTDAPHFDFSSTDLRSILINDSSKASQYSPQCVIDYINKWLS